MAFRHGRLRKELTMDAAEYTSSLRVDLEIVNAALVINAVHLKQLYRLGYLDKSSLVAALTALRELMRNPPPMTDFSLEDVHIVIEEELRRRVPLAADMLSLGKSRNDTVSAAIRIRVRERGCELIKDLLDLIVDVVEVSEREASTIFPVYTHMQPAMPATYGFVLSSYASRLIGAIRSLLRSISDLNRSPLGAAAIAGSSLPLDRRWVAEELGFEGLVTNALEATSSRDFLIDVLGSLLRIGVIFSDVGEDLVVLSSAEFGLIEMDESLSSTSSIMPNKKNPVVAEVMRTKVAEVVAELVRVASIISRRFGGYNLDLQQSTESTWRAFNSIESTVPMIRALIRTTKVNREKSLYACRPPIGMVELANKLVSDHKVPFRTAHVICGEISRALERGELEDSELESLMKRHGLAIKLTRDEIHEILDPVRVVESYRTEGSSNPSTVRDMARMTLREVEELRRAVEEKLEAFMSIYERAFSI
ncbi:MAG: argininosuccinate lyase [Aigarchaeota archaeon]|nr:argininosuccinate lyase [Aigarchaeota archaeon]MDW8093311.1 argininosuccinate lyase [Nitrososphaerota archaeon]